MSELISFMLGVSLCLFAVFAWPLPLTHVQCARKAKARIKRMPTHANGYCVYVLFHNERIAYVGMTNRFSARISEHRRAGKQFTHYRAIRRKTHGNALRLERHLIELFTASGEAKLNRNYAKG